MAKEIRVCVAAGPIPIRHKGVFRFCRSNARSVSVSLLDFTIVETFTTDPHFCACDKMLFSVDSRGVLLKS